MDLSIIGEYGALGGLLIIVWKGMEMVTTIFHETRQSNGKPKDPSSDKMKSPYTYDGQMAMTIKGLHQSLDLFVENQGKLVLGQSKIVEAIQETGRNMVKSIVDHNDNTERMAREINRVTRETATTSD
uniref:Uncharacterized protein n=1 Tax=viral metagenome TaxID=1070528 RepID=A0A6M3KTS7_9ZZZZ